MKFVSGTQGFYEPSGFLLTSRPPVKKICFWIQVLGSKWDPKNSSSNFLYEKSVSMTDPDVCTQTHRCDHHLPHSFGHHSLSKISNGTATLNTTKLKKYFYYKKSNFEIIPLDCESAHFNQSYHTVFVFLSGNHCNAWQSRLNGKQGLRQEEQDKQDDMNK